MNTAVRPATRLRPEKAMTATAASIVTTPTTAATPTVRPALRSSAERVIASRGSNDTASRAGTAEAASAAPIPATRPLLIVSAPTSTSVADTRK